ncbi:DEAD/DEAH box helicase [Haloglomus litoreum]|uniref:DEAD/DEAH box helicase n=1 Tax=Haloglomus litoreum TaxID=3034026 RepID=UPI0023E87E3F|nr:DEAD/DEAH box helicase [Haloglomus sp. DT116]
MAPPETEVQKEIAPTQSSDERVLFFPSRREIAVDKPAQQTRSILSQAAHLVDSTGDSYLYKLGKQDVWNAPYDDFEQYRDELKLVVGEERWDGGFESRIQDDWQRAHQFYLRTEIDSEGREITVLEANDSEVFENVAKRKLEHNTHYTRFLSDTKLRVRNGGEAGVKERLYEEGYPVIDQRRLEDGETLHIELNDDFELRDYQSEWVDHFLERRSGVFVGPSGSGKTVAAIASMEAIGGETLILVPTRELAQQWEDELAEKTTLTPYDIGQYHGGEKKIRSVTIATYDTAAMSRHRKLFQERDWGLVIADECHHSVASTWKRFREIQSKARLGLSATPIRESGDAKEIYTLIGPPVGTDWGSLFAEGWVSQPDVELLMVPWASERARERYQQAEGSQKLIEAAKNPAKASVVRELLTEHSEEKTLVFVDWVDQGKELSSELGIPFIYGETAHDEREERYRQFRDGNLDSLIISRIGDEGIDLPDAEVAILASTRGASRAQTGQRAGRTMRPFGDSKVYVLLTKGSGEEDWGRESTQYLAEKGIDISKRSAELE